MTHQHDLCPTNIDNLSVIQPCQSFDLPNNDTVKVSNFVLHSDKASSQLLISRVLEMLHVASGAGSYVYLLVRLYTVSGFVAPYRCPVIHPKDPEAIKLIEARVSHRISSCKVLQQLALSIVCPSGHQHLSQLCTASMCHWTF
jgi:hypothetical protein